MRLAELLQQYRARAHLSQEELAERAGISARTIGDIETGVALWPRAITVSLIAEALNLDASDRETLRSASSRRGLRRGSSATIPQTVELVGRDREKAALRALLLDSATRLVTLTGGPGVGKTALAATVAAELTEAFPDAVRFIEFATLPDAMLAPTKIAIALGVRDVRGASVVASIAAAIGDRPMLLVLDNFERMTGASTTIAELLGAARNVKMLVTSRTALRLSMVRQMKLEPLSFESSEQLLNARAGAPIDDSDLADLTRALGGVPLAIELAAPLLRNASAAELTARLQHPLDVLVAMRDAVGYSYGLLSLNERRLFRALAVFDGPFTEDGAHRVSTDGSGGTSSVTTLQTLAALIDRSLVGVSEDPAGEPEFSVHPLVSEFASEALERERESEAAYLQLADYCSALARVPPQPEPYADPVARARVSRESSHFDAALGWLRATKHIARALSLAIELWPIWYRRGATAHGYAWVLSLLDGESAEPVDEGLLADAHWAAAGLAEQAGKYDDGELHGLIALEQKRTSGDRAALASVLAGLGVCASNKGDYDAARDYLEESLAIRRNLGDGLNVARALLDFGTLASDEGRFDVATAALDEALTLFRAAGRRMGGSSSLGTLALVKVRLGAPRLGADLAREAARIAEEIGFKDSADTAKLTLSRALIESGDVSEARHLLLDLATGDASGGAPSAETLRALAEAEFHLAHSALAARLAGAAEGVSLRVIPLADRPSHELLVASLREALGPDFDAQWSAGLARGARAVLGDAQLRE
ncbi:MAG TPA: tetratricopeptide repeat protein [Candidatus Cybelea sp.]|nr:tetratricopeptide repeat protein [Candidatus Cybelea sp.]